MFPTHREAADLTDVLEAHLLADVDFGVGRHGVGAMDGDPDIRFFGVVDRRDQLPASDRLSRYGHDVWRRLTGCVA